MKSRTPKLRLGPPPPKLLLALVVAITACGVRPATAGPDSSKLVVVVYPHESDGAPGIALVNRGIRSAFADQPLGRIDVRNEYVDISRLEDSDYMRAQEGLLRQKYAGRKVDLVIAVLSGGLDFALAVRGEVFPGVPIVFVLVDRRELEARRLPPDVIGAPTPMDLTGTLDLAIRLHPDTRRVFVVAGSSPFDAKSEERARLAFQGYGDRVEFVYLTGLPMADLFARVAELPDGSLIYYLHVFKDGAGRDFVPADVLERLAARANAPVYSHVDTFIDRGAVGGHAYVHEAEGRVAARLGLRLLSGERPEAVTAPGAGQATYLFNGRELRRWGIAENSLPPGSTVRYKEPTFWDAYWRPVVGIAAICTIQTLLIVGLLIQWARRRRAEVAARESEDRFRRMADSAPVLIWASGVDKGGTYFNRPWLEFTGRTLQLELGEGWTEGIHPDDRTRCLEECAAHFDAREPFEMVFRLRRHDGEYRWVLDRGIPRHTPGGEFAGYVGACIDVTADRQAEASLLASQQELRLLTGRLLEAQEAERRRIARELHDDLNQRLALLSVELDLLGQRAPASAREVATGLRAVSARVKELSSAVHDLSHQLHPSKLEHLGLVGAVRALCQEMSRHHGLEVGFTHRDIPAAIPEAVTLCLYRIAQEALRNVVKHSGTDYATVELTGRPGAVRLRIHDAGVGFDPAAAGGDDGLGLVSMRERLYLVGGRLVVEARPGAGTRIDACVPLGERAEPAPGAPAARESEADLVTAGAAEDS
jgi:PAS domain S-box-containing protein